MEGSASNQIPPHVQQLTVDDRTFALGPQARLLGALMDYLDLADARPAVFDLGPLSGSPAFSDGPSTATSLVAFQVENVTERLAREGFLLESWHPDAGQERAVSAVAYVDALVALSRVRARGIESNAIDQVLANAFRHLTGYFRQPEGDYATRLSAAFGVEPGPKRLDVQLAVLRMLLLSAEAGGDAEVLGAADALWARLETLWWDDDVGLWQSTLGLADYRYSSALFARALDTARLAVRAGLPQAQTRLQRVAQALMTHGRLGETWLSGEVDGAGDADGDGVPHFGAVGLPPVPVDQIVF